MLAGGHRSRVHRVHARRPIADHVKQVPADERVLSLPDFVDDNAPGEQLHLLFPHTRLRGCAARARGDMACVAYQHLCGGTDDDGGAVHGQRVVPVPDSRLRGDPQGIHARRHYDSAEYVRRAAS